MEKSLGAEVESYAGQVKESWLTQLRPSFLHPFVISSSHLPNPWGDKDFPFCIIPMAIFTAPRSFQHALAQDSLGASLIGVAGVNVQSNHPSFFHLVLLVFEAVLEVVCVSLPGYIVAYQGMFDAEAQKFVANLNVMLFTPCLSMRHLPYHLIANPHLS